MLNKQKVKQLLPKEWDDTKLAAEVGIAYPTLRAYYDGTRNPSKAKRKALIRVLGSEDIFNEEKK